MRSEIGDPQPTPAQHGKPGEKLVWTSDAGQARCLRLHCYDCLLCPSWTFPLCQPCEDGTILSLLCRYVVSKSDWLSPQRPAARATPQKRLLLRPRSALPIRADCYHRWRSSRAPEGPFSPHPVSSSAIHRTPPVEEWYLQASPTQRSS